MIGDPLDLHGEQSTSSVPRMSRRIAAQLVSAIAWATAAWATAAGVTPAWADEAQGGVGGPGAGPSGDKGTFGAGIMIGEPTGICGRLYVKDDQAIQGAVGVAFIGGGFQIHADYAFHPYILQSRETFALATYVGPGVRLVQYSDGRGDSYFAAGVRAVGGLLFDFKNPLDAFFEVAAVFEYGFADDKGFDVGFNAGAGVRYYF
jgi:hypothetical protein